MKKLTLIFTLLVSTAMFSSPSFSEWRKLTSNASADYYIDIERIRKTDEYIYYWEMGDLFKPLGGSGTMSVKTYNQADCEVFRIMRLSISFHKEPLGMGPGETFTPEKEWLYPAPTSSMEDFTKFVCDFAKYK